MGININTLRTGVARWEHSETHFFWYSRLKKPELVRRIMELKDMKIGDEPTLQECILKQAYGI
jgi:hypothetical protein